MHALVGKGIICFVCMQEWSRGCSGPGVLVRMQITAGMSCMRPVRRYEQHMQQHERSCFVCYLCLLLLEVNAHVVCALYLRCMRACVCACAWLFECSSVRLLPACCSALASLCMPAWMCVAAVVLCRCYIPACKCHACVCAPCMCVVCHMYACMSAPLPTVHTYICACVHTAGVCVPTWPPLCALGRQRRAGANRTLDACTCMSLPTYIPRVSCACTQRSTKQGLRVHVSERLHACAPACGLPCSRCAVSTVCGCLLA